MRTLFVAAVAVLVVIGIDGWLCLRTLTPGALARSPTFNPLIVNHECAGFAYFALW
jgi:hypothetical protein